MSDRPTTWLLCALLFALGVSGWVFWPRIERLLSPTTPVDPDDEERPDSGADPEYGDDLKQLRHSERELEAIAEELELDLLDKEQRNWAVDTLDLRLMVAEDIDHFDQRLNRILDDWAPGWFTEPAPVEELPTFGAVHALVDDTSEWKLVTVV